MKRSTVLTPIRKVADLIPAAQPVFDHLASRLGFVGKCPAFFAEARDYLDDAAKFANRNGQPMLGQMYETASTQMSKKAVR